MLLLLTSRMLLLLLVVVVVVLLLLLLLMLMPLIRLVLLEAVIHIWIVVQLLGSVLSSRISCMVYWVGEFGQEKK